MDKFDKWLLGGLFVNSVIDDKVERIEKAISNSSNQSVEVVTRTEYVEAESPKSKTREDLRREWFSHIKSLPKEVSDMMLDERRKYIKEMERIAALRI